MSEWNVFKYLEQNTVINYSRHWKLGFIRLRYSSKTHNLNFQRFQFRFFAAF